jgi:hypothetical protein
LLVTPVLCIARINWIKCMIGKSDDKINWSGIVSNFYYRDGQAVLTE